MFLFFVEGERGASMRGVEMVPTVVFNDGFRYPVLVER